MSFDADLVAASGPLAGAGVQAVSVVPITAPAVPVCVESELSAVLVGSAVFLTLSEKEVDLL